MLGKKPRNRALHPRPPDEGMGEGRCMKALLAWVALFVAASAAGDDYGWIISLEQDVRRLEREVSTLARELAELKRHAGASPAPIDSVRRPLDPPSDKWIDAKKWHTLRLGTDEMTVIETLGPPTSMRVEEDTQGERRILLYALEIGSSGFLSGSVTLRDRKVIAIEPPVLK
jgi:hypothetical protein